MFYYLFFFNMLLTTGVNPVNAEPSKEPSEPLVEINLLNKELNESILDGFFDNDSTKVPDDTYLLKLN